MGRVNSRETTGSGPVNILPIPPRLEFPYPRSSTNSSEKSSPSKLAHDTNRKEQDIVTPSQGAHEEIYTPGLLDQTIEPARPTLPNRSAMTEGPRPTKPARSFLGVRRAATGEPPNALSRNVSFDADSESASSSEDEIGNLVRVGSAHASKAKDLAGRRPSNDPYRRFSVGNENFKSHGHVSKKDGRLKISLKETELKGYLAKTLSATLNRRLGTNQENTGENGETKGTHHKKTPEKRPGVSQSSTMSSLAASVYDQRPMPRLKIVIMVIGSRGDIQPFLRLGKTLKEEHGHRVRIATHPAFRDFVEKDTKLEFFSVGGDPSELMAFMVKNPGLIPKPETIRHGEIAKKREAMYEMFKGFWRACINTTDDEHDLANLKLMGEKTPFIADAIIANPPSFAHIHCAERLGVPLHLMFTFPTSPTQQFPHPLANIKQTEIDSNYTNFMSYPLVEMMQWQGLGDLINKFRIHTLGLDPVSTLWAPGQLFRLQVPYSYLWSPGLIPKPADWGPEIDITGFVFLDLASSFKPARELKNFLDAGDPPVYIGFGSIVVDDPDKFTSLIFEAVKKAGVRALVSKGWGGLGDENNTPDNIYMLGNTPHDWLFPRVSGVVHHGGAGTTAIGLKCGKPTMIVPFFGDQPFWGSMVYKAGAGAKPVPYKKLTAEILAESIKILLKPETQECAKGLSSRIEEEGDGALNAVKSFHRSLPLRGNHSLRCSILEDRVAVWWLKGRHTRLSAIAAEILVERKKIKWSNLKLIRHYEWSDFEGPGEPISGAGSAVSRNVRRIVSGVGRTPFKLATRIKEERRKSDSRKSTSGRNGEQSAPKNHRGKGEDLPEDNATASQPQTNRNDNQRHEDRISAGENTSKSTQDQSGQGVASRLPVGNDLGKPLTQEMKQETMSRAGTSKPIVSKDTASEKDVGEDLAADLISKAVEGFAETGKGIAGLPRDITLALAQGFHNAPRLWGDNTVRTPTRVTGFKSGLKAARREFTYGIYDGWTGVVKHPINGAKKEGVMGFTKGIGKGLGGFVLKDFSAIVGLPAYTMKGIGMEFNKSRQPKAFIRRAQIIQGRRDVADLSKEDLRKTIDVINKGWKVIDLIDEEIHATEETGIKGKIEVEKGKRKWRKHAVFENVEQTSKAFRAYQEGKDFNEEFGQHTKEVQKQLGPRKSAMQYSKSRSQNRQSKGTRKSTEIAGEQTGTEVQDQISNSNGGTPEMQDHGGVA